MRSQEPRAINSRLKETSSEGGGEGKAKEVKDVSDSVMWMKIEE